MANWDTYSNSLRSFPHRSFSWNLLQKIMPLLGNPKPLGDARIRSGLIKSLDGGATRMYFEAPGVPVSQRDIRALEKTGSTLAVAYGMCARQGAELSVVFVPTKYRIYNGIVETEPDSEIVNWTVNDLPTRLHETIAGISDDIGFIDLTPLFLEEAEKGAMLYYADDSHWTPEGHQIAAQAISDHLGW